MVLQSFWGPSDWHIQFSIFIVLNLIMISYSFLWYAALECISVTNVDRKKESECVTEQELWLHHSERRVDFIGITGVGSVRISPLKGQGGGGGGRWPTPITLTLRHCCKCGCSGKLSIGVCWSVCWQPDQLPAPPPWPRRDGASPLASRWLGSPLYHRPYALASPCNNTSQSAQWPRLPDLCVFAMSLSRLCLCVCV